MEHVIRKADRRHLAEINALLVAAKMAPYDSVPDLCWFVRQDGRIAGSVCGERWRDGVFVIKRLVVAPDFRKRHIGMALFDHATDVAVDHGDLVALLTMYYHFNRFKRRGFRTVPRKDAPERVMSHPMFSEKRFMKCAVMLRQIA